MTEINERQGWSRRDSLRLLAGGATVATLFQLPKKAAAATAPVSLDDVTAMTPLSMAERSAIVTSSYKSLLDAADEIADPALRLAVSAILKAPAAKLLERLPSDTEKSAVRQQLIDAELLKDEVTLVQLFPPASSPAEPCQPFYTAPGSGYTSHHAYPGGLATHVALNTRSSLGLYAGYRDTYGARLSRDIVLASQLLHDLHKPWVFQWQADGSSMKEYVIAGTGAHHILSVAESIYRGLPADMIVAQASAHDHPGNDNSEAKVVGYLKAGAIIAGQDPIAYGLLAADGKTIKAPRRIESFVTHIGDHDWIITGSANKWTTPVLKDIAARDYGMKDADLTGKPFNQFRNFIYAQATMIGMHHLHCEEGVDAVRKVVNGLVKTA